MNEIIWKVTDQQAEQIAAIFDLACKAGGIDAAKVAVPLMDSLMTAVNEHKEKLTAKVASGTDPFELTSMAGRE